MSLNHMLSKACWFVDYAIECTFHQASSNQEGRGQTEHPSLGHIVAYKNKALGGA